MASPVRVGQGDHEVRHVEGEVVVAAVPEYYIRFLLRGLEDLAVVDAGVHDDAAVDVGFVLLAFLDGALMQVEVIVCSEALDCLLGKVAIRHRMPDRYNLKARVDQRLTYIAGGLALSHTGADRADRNHRRFGLDHGRGRSHQTEIGARRIDH